MKKNGKENGKDNGNEKDKYEDMDYRIDPVPNDPKKIKITFKHDLHADTTRAMLLMAGRTPKELGLDGTSKEEVEVQARELEIELKGISPKGISKDSFKDFEDSFNAFYRLAYALSHDLRALGEKMGVELSLPKITFDSKREKVGGPIFPAMVIDKSSYTKHFPHKEIVKSLNEHGLISTENGRIVDIDAKPKLDLIRGLEKHFHATAQLARAEGRGWRERY